MTFLPSPPLRRVLALSSPREFRCPSPFVMSPTRRKCRHSDLYPEAWRWFESPARLWVARSFGPHNSITVDVAIFLFRSFFVLTEKIQRKRKITRSACNRRNCRSDTGHEPLPRTHEE